MAVIKDEYLKIKDIAIGIDPGYDSTKVCINGVLIKVPNNVVDITGHAEDFLTLGEKKAPGFLSSSYVVGKQYLVGELARKSVREKENRERFMNKTDIMDSYDRFETIDFEVNLMTVIGYALVTYAKLTMENDWKPEMKIVYDEAKNMYRIPDLKNFRIVVGVALPNDAVDAAWPSIERMITRDHNYEIETADGVWSLGFSVPKGHCTRSSQVICALLGIASDDQGYIGKDSGILKNLPTVVVDGGYKTVGLFMLTQAHKVSAAESNVDYAMGNVHKEVAKCLRDDYGRKNIEAYQIPSILEEDNGVVIYKSEKGNTASVQIKDMILQKEKELCNGLIDYLNHKFEDLLDVKQIIITGGTGAAYYNHISAYMNEKRSHLKNKVLLTDYEFNGKKIEPVYAIAVAMYKSLRYQLLMADKAAKAQKATEEKKKREEKPTRQ